LAEDKERLFSKNLERINISNKRPFNIQWEDGKTLSLTQIYPSDAFLPLLLPKFH